MKIEIARSKETGKWSCSINDKMITEQSTLLKLFHKMWKYSKSQGI